MPKGEPEEDGNSNYLYWAVPLGAVGAVAAAGLTYTLLSSAGKGRAKRIAVPPPSYTPLAQVGPVSAVPVQTVVAAPVVAAPVVTTAAPVEVARTRSFAQAAPVEVARTRSFVQGPSQVVGQLPTQVIRESPQEVVGQLPTQVIRETSQVAAPMVAPAQYVGEVGVAQPAQYIGEASLQPGQYAGLYDSAPWAAPGVPAWEVPPAASNPTFAGMTPQAGMPVYQASYY